MCAGLYGRQDTVVRSHCGGQRYAFNWGLAQVMDQHRDAELTPSLSWSAYSLRKIWNQAKSTMAPWWAENSKEAYLSGLANLATALGNWNASKAGKRRGPKVRFLRFTGKRHGMSCRFTTGVLGLVDRNRLHVERGTARIRSATVPHRAGRWQVSSSVETQRPGPCPTGVGGGYRPRDQFQLGGVLVSAPRRSRRTGSRAPGDGARIHRPAVSSRSAPHKGATASRTSSTCCGGPQQAGANGRKATDLGSTDSTVGR
jgi:hypothetical protein